MKFAAHDWPVISALLDEALDLPAERRGRWLDELPDGPRAHRHTLERLLADHASVETLDFMRTLPKVGLGDEGLAAAPEEGSRTVGPYRLLREIGRGGMGSVWLAERVDGLLKRQVALKLPHPGLATHAFGERLARERDILASLTHPHIARLYDAGVTPEGQPYIALAYVQGQTLIEHCNAHGLAVRERIVLFQQVLDAVQYAHAHLVIHRDLKPSNVLVDEQSQVHLLDFGIAKLLVDGRAEATELTLDAGRALTPGYASPEQNAGGVISTASDLYSLGVVLFELLTGVRPFPGGRPHRDEVDAPQASRAVSEEAGLRVGALGTARLRKLLRGDLDAIVAKALERDPTRRYESAAAFSDDLNRFRRHEPTIARPVGMLIVMHKFVRRHRAATALAGGLFLAVLAGAAGIVWQGLRAEREAALAHSEANRAAAIKDFLIGVFKASDPRIASDKPRGTVTARELLDISTDKIEKEFSKDPDTELELLGITADIYGELDEDDRSRRLLKRHVELARKRYGNSHPIVIEGLLKQAAGANRHNEYGQALKLLDETDTLLRSAHLDRSAARALWWLTRGGALIADRAAQAQHAEALEHSVALYAAVAPHDRNYSDALSDLASVHANRLEFGHAHELYERAVAVQEGLPDRDDGELSQLYANLALNSVMQGDYDAAERSYRHAGDLARRTYGVKHRYFWIITARHAQVAHLRGDRDRAMQMFDELKLVMPSVPAKYHDADEELNAALVHETYGGCLSAEGRPGLAIPILETAQREFIEAPQAPHNLARLRGVLGVAYAREGNTESASQSLKSALDGYVSLFPASSPGVLQRRQQWGSFLLHQGKVDEAAQQFQQVLAQSTGNASWVALSHGGMAEVALRRHDTTAALESSARAIDVADHVVGIHDVRMGPALWRIRADALLLAGDAPAAVEWAQRALDAHRRYDDSSSSSITAAAASLRAAVRIVEADRHRP